MPESRTNAEPEYPRDEHYDEIELADVALAIWRRRWLFVGVFAAVFGLSVIFAFMKPVTHEFHTTIQIGYIAEGRDLAPIEATDRVQNRLQEVHIPQNRYLFREQNPEVGGLPEIRVTQPDGGSLLTIRMEDGPANADRNRELLGRIVEEVTRRHDEIFDIANTEREAQLAAARNELQALETQEAVIKADLERMDRQVELVEKNLESLRESVAEAEAQRQQVVETATEDQKAMTLLLVDSQIRYEQRQLRDLEERLSVDLERERDQLEAQLSDNQRAQENQRKEIETLVAKTRAMERTRAVIPPSMSLDPVGPGKRLILAFGFVLAGMLAVLAVGVSGLVARARHKMARENAV